MKKPNDDIRELLQRQISGEANAGDAKTLGVLAEGDPFLQDALEGFEALPAGNHEQRLAQLKTRLRQRTRKRVLAALSTPLRRIAAVLVIGLMASALWWLFRPHAPTGIEQSLAVQDAPVPAPGVAAIEDSAPQSPVEERPAVPVPLPKSQPDNRKTPDGKPQKAESEHVNLQNFAQTEPSDTPIANRNTPAETPEDTPPPSKPAHEAASPSPSTGTTAPSAPAARNRSASPLSISESAKPQTSDAPLIISGKVTDAAGEPLVGVSIQLAGTLQGVVTNQEGRYELVVPVHVNLAKLIVSYTGYATQTVQAIPGSQLNIILSESDLTLNEVSVTGEPKRKQTGMSSATWITPKPRGGFSALEAHIARHKQMPTQAVSTPADATSWSVELRFSVLPNGRLQDFTEIRSPGAEWTQEAIRLLRTGPRWENKTGRRQTARYTVVF